MPETDGDAMTLAALRIGVSWRERVESHLKSNGIPFERRGNAVIVKPDAAFGATLVFEAESE
jgi:hypothetical protein